ncbi:hypothetical protein LJC48_04520 [Desulfovibrio sp. OttesenSCG-928-C06]|nr:hypothetical protein [Desulfovibrio sp. OttesenSCG-928-C06]
MRLSPPRVLLIPSAEPEWSGDTNADLLDWSLGLRAALRSCNADKAAITEWGQE